MHCKSCNYPLWNLATRTCPECGAGFRPSDFEFVPNSVRFCCPKCKLAYYGTSAKGHLIPHVFDCVGCGGRITMDDCVLLPAEGVVEAETKPQTFPWLDPHRRWALSGWFSMVVTSLCLPKSAARSIPPPAPSGFIFGCGTLLFTWFMGVGLIGAVITITEVAAGQQPIERALKNSALWTASSLLAIVGGLAVWIVLAHGLLRLTGPIEYGLSRTCHALCYTTPGLIPMAIPCIGPCFIPIFALWWMIVAGVMLAYAQKTGIARGLLASVVPPIASIIVVIIINLW